MPSVCRLVKDLESLEKEDEQKRKTREAVVMSNNTVRKLMDTDKLRKAKMMQINTGMQSHDFNVKVERLRKLFASGRPVGINIKKKSGIGRPDFGPAKQELFKQLTASLKDVAQDRLGLVSIIQRKKPVKVDMFFIPFEDVVVSTNAEHDDKDDDES